MIEKILKCIYIDDLKLNYKEMLKKLKSSNIKLFNKSLDKLKNDGVIFKDKDGRFVKSKKEDIYFGVYEGTRKGFGFLLLEEENDIFIPRTSLNGCMDRDTVIVRLIEDKCTSIRKVGEVIYVIEHYNKEIIGEYQDSKFFGFVIPRNYNINYDIYIPKKYKMGAKSGDIVSVKITKYPSEGKKPEGIVSDILGNKDRKDINMRVLMKKYNLKEDFPKGVLNELKRFHMEVIEDELSSRRDLRDLPIVTIDGSDAKDLDDAVYVKRQGEEYILSVHIADVSHYVRYRSELDKEALKRGTSVYLIDKVVPMLPKELSNDLCSLNSGTDKLTLSCEMVINKSGEVTRYDIFESVIRTKYRLTYDNVQDIIDGNTNEFSDIYEMIFNMKDLAEILNSRRERRGAINFDFPECKISLNEDGDVLDISAFMRKFSHNIIEEFMLLCNETIAEHMFFLNYPFPYRIHEEPDMEKIMNLRDILHNLDYNFRINDKVYSNQIQKVLMHFKGKDEEMFLSKFILRSMSKARYLKDCIGHFGLSTKYYCHFTSPIRRYPDLVAHRIIKLSLKGGIGERLFKNLSEEVSICCENSSLREMEAEECERELYDIKKAEFMKDKIGEEYTGIISSLTSFGFFVDLLNTVRGLVHVNDMEDDDYYFDEESISLIGRENKNVFKIGMKVQVKVLNVILENNEIYFGLSR